MVRGPRREPDRYVLAAALANDLTKMFEKVERGTLSSLIASTPESKLKGEYIVVIAGKGRETSNSADENEDVEE